MVKHMEGGMGDVYKVVDPSLVEFFSIKTLKHSINASEFKNECEIFVTASQHRSCVKPVGYGLIDSHPAIGYHWHASSLADHNSKNWKTAEIENLLSDLMDFFHYACSNLKILHCDIKPSNILIASDKKPYVADFGISKMAEHLTGVDHSRAIVGTREYVAPELLFTGKQNVKSELYSFGITIYEFLTGEHPYLSEMSPVENSKKISRNLKRLNRTLGRSMSDYLNFVGKCISLESSRRPECFKLPEKPNGLVKIPKDSSIRSQIESIAMQSSFFRKEKNFEKAERILLDSIRSFGRSPILLNALGLTYACSRSREDAIVPFEEASRLVLDSYGFLNSALYLDPVINLSAQYRCLKRFQDSSDLLKQAWEIVKNQDSIPFSYSEFGWMMVYEGDFHRCCSYMSECFAHRSVQPFEMLCFTEAAWISGQIGKYSDIILSKVIYNSQFNELYFLCAFVLSKYSSLLSVERMHLELEESTLLSIAHIEIQLGISTGELRPPKTKMIEAIVIQTIDNGVTGGKHNDLIHTRLKQTPIV